MKECSVYFYEKETNMLLDEFIIEYQEISDIYNFVDRVYMSMKSLITKLVIF